MGRVRNRSEAELAGYTAALDYVLHANDDEVSVGLILHLHRLLYALTDGHGGSFKADANVVVDRDADGKRRTRFVPVSAVETPYFTAELVERTNDALRSGVNHPLVITAAFVLDFLCVHPFADGNGRVARLITAFLAQRSGYRIGRYVSVEQLIHGSKQDRVREYVLDNAPNTFSMADIRLAVPGVSDNTIRLVLAELKRDGRVVSEGTGRGATWRRLPSP